MEASNNIIVFLEILGFYPQEGESEIYIFQLDNTQITVNTETLDVNYGPLITVGDKTTSNLDIPESKIVLECVIRLLNKGYPPEMIFLEKKWLLGRKEKGKLDIWVKDKSKDECYLMIECKTPGKQFLDETKKMKQKGGQLFSYFMQDRSAKYLCLYTSKIIDSEITYQNKIISVDPEWRKLNTIEDVVKHWNKNYKENGLFESNIPAYQVEPKSILNQDLKPLTKLDSSVIYNQFLEILRHNIVSDKPNAFNKMLNLFICKIIDEDKRSSLSECAFQWKHEDTEEELLNRLNELYKEGMQEFLGIEVVDISETELNTQLKNVNSSSAKKMIKTMFNKLRLQKNPEFSFKEVFNEDTFLENGKVVREVVELLQPYKFRYGQKQQFLGDFFELLLNTSVKQESGQFFTPVPIAKFIIHSLPLKEKIEHNIQNLSYDALPTMIDYAAGSGHFLTEYMDIIQTIIENYSQKENIRKTTLKQLKAWKEDPFSWAKDYVYGIEADYRLVKTAKVNSFLNGDGSATIIQANGLDSFEKSKYYVGKLKEVSKDCPTENEKFDILIANPPYSVSAFKSNVPDGANSFDLFNYLTDQSSEIECLFVERMKQLLTIGGIAGIILPSSVLSNTKIYLKTRELIFQNFDIISIVKLGASTFMATGVNTIILFLRKKDKSIYLDIEDLVNQEFVYAKGTTINGIPNALETYVTYMWEDISLDDYLTLLFQKPNSKVMNHSIYKNYAKNKSSKTLIQIIEMEKQKFLYYILSANKKIVLEKTGDKSNEKEVLGYEFSTRRGSEGIRPINGNLTIDECTMLYSNRLEQNSAKMSFYIQEAFKNNFEYPISDALSDYVSYIDLVDLIDFHSPIFEKRISLTPMKKKIDYKEIFRDYGEDLKPINELSDIKRGTIITKKDAIPGDFEVIAGGKNSPYTHNISNRNGEVVTVSASGANAGYINYFSKPIFASDCLTIQSKSNESIRTKYIYIMLHKLQKEVYSLSRGQAQPHIYISDIENIKIPVVSIKEQDKLISSFEKEIEENTKRLSEVDKINSEIRSIFNNISQLEIQSIRQVADVSRGASPRPISKYLTNDELHGIPWIKIGDVLPDEKYITTTAQRITEEGKMKSRYLEKGNLIVSNSMSPGRPYILGVSGCIHDGWLSLTNFSNSYLPEFLYYLLKSEIVQEQFKKMSSGGTSVDNLNISLVENVNIPWVSLQKQREILETINTLEEQKSKLLLAITEKNF